FHGLTMHDVHVENSGSTGIEINALGIPVDLSNATTEKTRGPGFDLKNFKNSVVRENKSEDAAGGGFKMQNFENTRVERNEAINSVPDPTFPPNPPEKPTTPPSPTPDKEEPEH